MSLRVCMASETSIWLLSLMPCLRSTMVTAILMANVASSAIRLGKRHLRHHRVGKAVDGANDNLNAQHHEHARDGKARQRFELAVAIGVVLIHRAGRHRNADEAHDVGRAVAQAVKAVSGQAGAVYQRSV